MCPTFKCQKILSIYSENYLEILSLNFFNDFEFQFQNTRWQILMIYYIFYKIERIVWFSRFQILDTGIVPAQADLTVFLPASTLKSFYFTLIQWVLNVQVKKKNSVSLKIVEL